MFQKTLFLDFYGNMRGRDHSYLDVQLATWNVTKEKLHQIYFLAAYLKSLAASVIPVGLLGSAVS